MSDQPNGGPSERGSSPQTPVPFTPGRGYPDPVPSSAPPVPAQQPGYVQPFQPYAQPGYAPQPQPAYAPPQPQPQINVNTTVQQVVGMGFAGPDKSVGVAYLLWFFFGILGIHQFYLGKTGRGISYLFTLGWLTVGLWIDLFTLPAQVKSINAQRRVGLR